MIFINFWFSHFLFQCYELCFKSINSFFQFYNLSFFFSLFTLNQFFFFKTKLLFLFFMPHYFFGLVKSGYLCFFLFFFYIIIIVSQINSYAILIHFCNLIRNFIDKIAVVRNKNNGPRVVN